MKQRQRKLRAVDSRHGGDADEQVAWAWFLEIGVDGARAAGVGVVRPAPWAQVMNMLSRPWYAE